MKPTLHVDTSVGHFTRQTDTKYTHIVVWRSPRARGSLASKHKTGVHARWEKDNGFGVTWHSSGKAAEAAARSYKWDNNATLVGVFAVSGPDILQPVPSGKAVDCVARPAPQNVVIRISYAVSTEFDAEVRHAEYILPLEIGQYQGRLRYIAAQEYVLVSAVRQDVK